MKHLRDCVVQTAINTSRLLLIAARAIDMTPVGNCSFIESELPPENGITVLGSVVVDSLQRRGTKRYQLGIVELDGDRLFYWWRNTCRQLYRDPNVVLLEVKLEDDMTISDGIQLMVDSCDAYVADSSRRQHNDTWGAIERSWDIDPSNCVGGVYDTKLNAVRFL